MATCFCVEQTFASCDGLFPTGSVIVTLAGPATCSLFDDVANAWYTTGKKGTVSLVDGKWTSPSLPCLDELSYNGMSATEAGFYYTFSVKISSGFTCEYIVLGDCSTMTVPLSGCIPIEDVMVGNAPVVGTGPDACATIKACETVTTLTNDGGGQYTYTNEAGGTTVIDVGSGGGTDNDIDNVTVAGSVFTFHLEDGSTITFDVCTIVAGNCNATLVANANGTWTHTANNGDTQNFGPFITTITQDDETFTATSTNGSTIEWVTGTGPVGSLIDNGAGSLVFDPGDGSDVTTIPICDLVDDGDCGGTGGDETVTTLVANANGTYTYTSEDDTETIIPAETISTLVKNTDGSYTYTNEDATVTTIAASSGDETVTTLTKNTNGTYTYKNEDAVSVTFGTADRDPISFPSRELVTVVGKSGLYQADRTVSIYAISMTAGVAPTGAETYIVRAITAAGTVSSVIGTGTLAANSHSTGIVAVVNYTMPVTEMLEVEITGVNGSERSTIFVYYREIDSELV